MAMAPFAASSLRMNEPEKSETKPEDQTALKGIKDNIEKATSEARKLYDRVYYGDVLPPVGSVRMSYARFLDLLHQRRVKRITVLGDGAAAIVEVPVEGWASDTTDVKHDRRNPEIMYAKQRPEWQMEKHRFYVELPGDFWENGVVMEKIKQGLPHRTAEGRIQYAWLLQEGQVTPELKVIDPGDQFVWLNQYIGTFIPIVALILLRMFLGFGSWLVQRFGKKKKDRMEEIAEQFSKSPAKSFNIKDGKDEKQRRGTGVVFSDVAGIDKVKNDIQEVLEMMLGEERFSKMGAKMPRGILLEGPPGTGKTYLAKAMAGEAGIPFFSANGAEFVEMFQGVAAARVRNLFRTARKNAPAIVFIDEIDAIGKRRTDGASGDSGTAEREHGLLQLLQEMDGFSRLDKVLVIGATNRIGSLDDALLRPGRFDRSIYMGMPSRSNRLKILEVHSKNKPVSRAPSDKWPEGNGLLNDIADLTIGYSGAELANLLNEAAILAVRQNKTEIDYETALAAMEKYKLGLEQPPIPDTPAKRHMAHVQAGRAVIAALTLGLPPIEMISMQPRGGTTARILYLPQETGRDGDEWHKLAYGMTQINAVEPQDPPGSYEFLKGLLVPLYAARATEEVLYGKRGVTLSTAHEVSRAGNLAHWLVRSSSLHPSFRQQAVAYSMMMGGYTDPVTEGMATTFEGLTLALQREAYAKAKQIVQARLTVIKQLATALCERQPATVAGKEIVEMLKTTPLDPVTEPDDPLLSVRQTKASTSPASGRSGLSSFQGGSGAASFHSPAGGADGPSELSLLLEQIKAELKVPERIQADAVEVLIGAASEEVLPGFVRNGAVSFNGADRADGNTGELREQAHKFAVDISATAPDPPAVPLLSRAFLRDSSLYDWAQKARDVRKEETEVLRL